MPGGAGGHRYSLLWANYGPHGEQDVHYHPCVSEGCDGGCSMVIEGPGRHCGGMVTKRGGLRKSHKRVDLEARLREKKEPQEQEENER